MSNHTPGIWNFHAQGEANSYCILTDEKRWVIAFQQNGEIWTDEQEANAILISAAPEMLAALEQFIHAVEHEGEVHGRIVDAVRNATEAIQKATHVLS